MYIKESFMLQLISRRQALRTMWFLWCGSEMAP